VLRIAGEHRLKGLREQHETGEDCITRSCSICTSGDQIKEDKMGEACGTCGKRTGAYRVLVGKPEGNNPPERKILHNSSLTTKHL
jgi:hypothetical protein